MRRMKECRRKWIWVGVGMLVAAKMVVRKLEITGEFKFTFYYGRIERGF